ncbi:structure-specific endonuclease subunit SLX1 homolog 2 [Sesamum indicum]|uniref:Structure-specific endonuclease subunit SLX1 homolog n=1 Tax=Sesamum indicum TaxID=4182 RepID=A0A6I9T8N6_SESIN|nr:structure-specific endonuclease subunit SLX1 homolog 2 [Sesamum indicum]
MGRRKGRKQTQKTLISTHENCQIGGEAEERKGEGFFACYLLTSLSPRFKGQTYIGFTVNPRRRIRQHNGEIGSGAWRTKRKRPWEMVLCIYGFPTNVAALQFEWAWQHPVKSLAVRVAAASFKSISGLANKIKLAYTMLTLPAWQSLNLTMNFFSTKYQIYISGCPTLPEQQRTQVRSMDELPCYNWNACLNDEIEADEEFEVSGSFEPSTSEESTRTVHDSPSNHCSFEENMHIEMNQKDNSSCELNECSEEREQDQRQTFLVLDNDYSFGASSSFVTDSCDIAGYTEAGQKCAYVSPDKLSIATFLSDKEPFSTEASWDTVSYIEDGQKSLDMAHQKQLTATSSSDKEPFSVEGPSIRRKVEVIDIFTPSPCYRVNTGSKKRRPAVYPEIIDLTNSPMFV